MSEMLYVFCYDVSDNRARRRIAKAMENQMVRVQNSVFEARMTDRAAEKLAKRAAVELDPGDSLKVYAVGGPGLRRCKTFGSGVTPQQGDFLLL